MKKINLRHVEDAINATCNCGGKGPSDGCCPACEVWHRLQRMVGASATTDAQPPVTQTHKAIAVEIVYEFIQDLGCWIDVEEKHGEEVQKCLRKAEGIIADALAEAGNDQITRKTKDEIVRLIPSELEPYFRPDLSEYDQESIGEIVWCALSRKVETMFAEASQPTLVENNGEPTCPCSVVDGPIDQPTVTPDHEATADSIVRSYASHFEGYPLVRRNLRNNIQSELAKVREDVLDALVGVLYERDKMPSSLTELQELRDDIARRIAKEG